MTKNSLSVAFHGVAAGIGAATCVGTFAVHAEKRRRFPQIVVQTPDGGQWNARVRHVGARPSTHPGGASPGFAMNMRELIRDQLARQGLRAATKITVTIDNPHGAVTPTVRLAREIANRIAATRGATLHQ